MTIAVSGIEISAINLTPSPTIRRLTSSSWRASERRGRRATTTLRKKIAPPRLFTTTQA